MSNPLETAAQVDVFTSAPPRELASVAAKLRRVRDETVASNKAIAQMRQTIAAHENRLRELSGSAAVLVELAREGLAAPEVPQPKAKRVKRDG